MSNLTTFSLYTSLPFELRLMILEFYRRGRVRHCFIDTQQRDSFYRQYAAINLETDRFAEAVQTKEYLEKRSKPSVGWRNSTIWLDHEYYYGKPGDAAKSPHAYKFPEGWPRASAPRIMVDYTTDIFMFQGRTGSTWGPFTPPPRAENRPYMGYADAWLPNVEYVAVTVPIMDDIDCLRVGFIDMEKLKHLYIVVYRDPDCPYGAPLCWENVKREMLNKGGFLEYKDWVEHHPKDADRRCTCETSLEEILEVEKELHAAYRWVHRSDIEMSIVADPY